MTSFLRNMEHLVPAKSLVTRRSHSFPHMEQPGRKRSRALISPRTRPTPLVALAVLARLLNNAYAVVTSWGSSPHPPSWTTSLLCTFKKLSWVNGNSSPREQNQLEQPVFQTELSALFVSIAAQKGIHNRHLCHVLLCKGSPQNSLKPPQPSQRLRLAQPQEQCCQNCVPFPFPFP